MHHPNFEEPINSAEDLLEKNITLFTRPAGYYWVQFLANSHIPEYNTISEKMIIAKARMNI